MSRFTLLADAENLNEIHWQLNPSVLTNRNSQFF
jgi:hypothetical protein